MINANTVMRGIQMSSTSDERSSWTVCRPVIAGRAFQGCNDKVLGVLESSL